VTGLEKIIDTRRHTQKYRERKSESKRASERERARERERTGAFPFRPLHPHLPLLILLLLLLTRPWAGTNQARTLVSTRASTKRVLVSDEGALGFFILQLDVFLLDC